jgi:NAD(P)-dependent dehydrogenase (short-subunit alcohol dehydrogenase family)
MPDPPPCSLRVVALPARLFSRAQSRDGARVATTARGPLPPGETPDLFIQADVSTPSGVAEVVARVGDAFGGVDILIHNVGGSAAPAGGFAVLDDENWQRALDANLLAAEYVIDGGSVPTV